MTGIEAFLEVLTRSGVTLLFGNPGTTELPLNAALARERRFRYIFGVHEIPVLAAADGYAMASGTVGVANVHICCGLGNAMGMLYNAHVAGTPLLLTAGQQDRRLLMQEPVLSGDMVSVARPWTKYAHEVHRVEDVPLATRRALQIASTPPTGPVFLALPVDLQMEERESFDLTPAAPAVHHCRPAEGDLGAAATTLLQAREPVILAGSRVTEAGAIRELVAVAEKLGAPVYSEAATSHGRLPFPTEHPLYRGALPLWSPDVCQCLDGHDVLLVVGMNLLREYIYREPARALPDGVRVVHLDCAAPEIGKNYPADVPLIGGIREGLAELHARLADLLSPEYRAAAHQRVERCRQQREHERQTLEREAAAQMDSRPLTALPLMTALARVLPPDAAVVDEAATTTRYLFEKLGALRDPAGYFGHRGWALGWGIGCAVGVKLAWPTRPVLALVGDGAALYGLQGLWTAAHHNIPVTFVVCNNRNYQILKACAGVLGLPAASLPGTDLVAPAVDFVALARGLGVEAHRVTGPDELAERVRQGLTGDRPLLLDLPVTP